MNRVLRLTISVLAVCSVAVLVGSTGAAAQEATELAHCDDITEPGTYVLTDDVTQVNGSGAVSCIEIRAENVTLDGNGHAVIGNGQTDEEGDSQGIYTTRGAYDVAVRNVEVRNWDTGIDHQSGGVLVVENAAMRANGNGLNMDQAGLEMQNVTFEQNDQALSHLVGSVRGEDVEVVDNGAGVTFGDGGGITFTNSTFNGNERYGIEVRHMMSGVEFRNVEVSGNGGPGVQLVGPNSRTIVENSEITENGGPGIDGTRTDGHEVELNDVHLDGNDGAVVAYRDGPYDDGSLISGTNVTLGSNVTATFDSQAVNLSSDETNWSATDAIGILGGEDTEIGLEFDVGAERGYLWEERETGWEVREEYVTSNGSFQVAVGNGTWTANASETQTATPTPTPAPNSSPGSDSTPTPTETPDPTPTPTEADTGSSGSSGGGGSGGSGGGSDGGGGGGALTTPSPTETDEPTETPTETDTATETATLTEGSGDSTGSAEEDNQVDEATETPSDDGDDQTSLGLLGTGAVTVIGSALVVTMLAWQRRY